MIRSRPFGNAAGSAARIAPSRRSEQLALVLLEIELSQEHIKNVTPKKRPAETGGRSGASIAKFRTPRPAHICETSRYRAVFERPSYVTRWRRTGWLRREDLNMRISIYRWPFEELMEFPPISMNWGIRDFRLD